MIMGAAERPAKLSTAVASSAEPLLALWRRTRELWACIPEDEKKAGKAVKAYQAAHTAFSAPEATTPLGQFLKMLDTDDGDDFADDHPEVVEAIILALQPADGCVSKADPVLALSRFEDAYAEVARLCACEPDPGVEDRKWDNHSIRANAALANAYSKLLGTPATTSRGISVKLRAMLKWEMGDSQRAAVTQAADVLAAISVTLPKASA
jgi:hypothetical protein